MIKLLLNANLFGPAPLGLRDILVADSKVAAVGAPGSFADFTKSQTHVEVEDLAGALTVPGFIDGHNHVIGGSGERGGFCTRSPEVTMPELIEAGVTTVVGTLGTDVQTRNMPALMGKVKAVNEEGLTAFAYTGGYQVPPATLMRTIRDDILFVKEIIGVGELAIADWRGSQPTLAELARIVSDAYVTGMLANKAGVCHFHLGPAPRGLSILFELLDGEFDICPQSLYPTHVNRGEQTLRQGIELTKRGAFVDFDTVTQELAESLEFYLREGGRPDRITITSDCAVTSTANLYGQIRDCALNHGYELAQLLPLVTTNPAAVLKLPAKGRIASGADADLVVLEPKSLEIRDVMALGQWKLKNRRLVSAERYLKGSNRRISATGEDYSGALK